MKTCQANTPLILQNEQGNDYRVERGATVELPDDVYTQVAAHVTVLHETPDSTFRQPENTPQPEQQPETEQPQPENPKPKAKGR